MTTTIPTVKKFPGIIIVSKPLTILRPQLPRKYRGVIIPSASRVELNIVGITSFTIASN
jgi:hypothetical protein